MTHVLMCRDSVVGIETGLRAGLSGVRISIGRQGKIILFSKSPSPLFNGYLGALQRMKLPGRDVDYPHATSAQVKNEWP